MGTRLGCFSPCPTILLATACVAPDARRDLEQVRVLVAERSGGDVVWGPERAAEQAIDLRVKELLSVALTTESAVELALLRNPALRTAMAEVEIAHAELVQAGLLRNPVLSADVHFALGASGTGAEMGIVQEFVSIFQIPLRTRVAEAELEVTKLSIAAAIYALAADVKAAFYAAQGAEQLLDLRRQVASATELAADVARRQHEAGNITDLDRANEQALHEEARLALAEAEIAALEAREGLTALLGLWGEETQWSIGQRLPRLPAVERSAAGFESIAVSRRLDLAAAQQGIRSAAAAVSLIRLHGLFPEAELGVEADREVEGGLWSLGPSIELPIPLFDQRQAQAAAWRARQHRAEADLWALAVAIRSDVRRAWARLAAARSRASYYEGVVLPLRRRILDETQREYNGMLVGVQQLLQAKRDEIETGGAYVAALRDYWLARVALERALGTELPLEGGTPSPSSLPEKAPAPGPPHHGHHHGG